VWASMRFWAIGWGHRRPDSRQLTCWLRAGALFGVSADGRNSPRLPPWPPCCLPTASSPGGPGLSAPGLWAGHPRQAPSSPPLIDPLIALLWTHADWLDARHCLQRRAPGAATRHHSNRCRPPQPTARSFVGPRSRESSTAGRPRFPPPQPRIPGHSLPLARRKPYRLPSRTSGFTIFVGPRPGWALGELVHPRCHL
jgi:hypothetical protein